MKDKNKEAIRILEENQLTNVYSPEDQIRMELNKAKEKKKHIYDKKMQEWIDRQEGYREYNKTHGDPYKILYSPYGNKT